MVGYASPATKRAAVGLVRAATTDLAPHGIRSNAVAPGLITPGIGLVGGVSHERIPAFIEHMERQTAYLRPLPRVGRASDVERAALFFASDDSERISGAILPVDGGAAAIVFGGAAPIELHGSSPRCSGLVLTSWRIDF